MSDWRINSNILSGYPHIADINNEKYNRTLPFRFPSNSASGWAIDGTTLNGYPFIFYKDLPFPVLPPVVVSVELNSSNKFYGMDRDLLIEMRLRHLQPADVIVLTIQNSADKQVYNEEILSNLQLHHTLSHTVPGAVLSAWDVDDYVVSVYVRRDINEQSNVFTVGLTVHSLPYVEAVSLDPQHIFRTESDMKAPVEIKYKVHGNLINSMINEFTIGNSSVVKPVNAQELIVIESSSPTPGFWDARFTFNVTDPEFKLISFKFSFGQISNSTHVDYMVNNTRVQRRNFPSGITPQWIEWVAPTPVHLNMGANLIQVTNEYGDFVMFSTTSRPTAPGMEITSSTVWAMEMVYSISSSGIEPGVEQTVVIEMGSDTSAGTHPLSIDSDMVLIDFGEHSTSLISDLELSIMDAPAIEFVHAAPLTWEQADEPVDIETHWSLDAALGEEFTITGSVGIQGTTHSSTITTDNRSFTVHLNNVSGLDAGLHSLSYNFVVSHQAYGSHTLTGTVANIFTVISSLPNPEVNGINISHAGRYIGSEINIMVEVQLAEIVAGDEIILTLRDGPAVLFGHAVTLTGGRTSYSHNFGAANFTGLAPGLYDIHAMIRRDGLTTSMSTEYEVVSRPVISFISHSPMTMQLPMDIPPIVTSWKADMRPGNTITGSVGIMGTSFIRTIDAEETDFEVSILNAGTISAGLHSFAYDFAVTHEVFGIAALSGVISNRLFVIPPLRDSGHGLINARATFANVANMPHGLHSLNTDISVTSDEYGTATVNTTNANVLEAEFRAMDGIELSVQGRYIGSEVPVTVRAASLAGIIANDVMRVEVLRNPTYHQANIVLTVGATEFSHVIPASVFVNAFNDLGTGECIIRVSMMRGGVALTVREAIYTIVPLPTVSFTGFVGLPQSFIQLPIFNPINLIASFQVSCRSNSFGSISGEVGFNNCSFTNAVTNSNGLLTVALTNITAIEPGSYGVSAGFNINTVFGQATISRTFGNVLTVFPALVTQGIEDKYTYDLILCHPSKQEISFIECFDVVFNPMFLQYNKLSFSVYREIVTEDNTVYLNPVWGQILSDGVVLLHAKINDVVVYKEYFVIENPSISYDGIDQLTFQAYSYEKIFLNNLDLSGFRDSVKRLYDPTNRIGDDNLPHGILNYILTMKWNNVWTLRHVDGTVLERERVLSFTGNNMSFVVDTLEESFHCVFVFDNVNMTLDIFERTIGMLGNNRGLVVADDTYASTITYQEDTTGIRTRVTVFGKNGGTIARYNPTGQLYVDDFRFYMNLQYMTQDLIDALTAYNALVASRYGVWTGFVERLDAGDETVIPLITALRLELAWENNFTQQQIRELTPFIKEETVTINTISDGRELYLYALRHIKTTAFIPIAISIDVIDVFALEQHKNEWLKFRIGDFANIYREEFDLLYKEMRLISYEHSPIKSSLRLEFSNRDELVTMQWLNNMFFRRIGDMENNYNNERDWYINIPDFEFDFNSPQLIEVIQNVVDNSIIEIDERVFNQIAEVFETQVLSADTAHILNAWIRYLKVDFLETNFEALDPRLPPPPENVRYFIRIQGITIQHIRSDLSATEVENYITPFGDQIFWTAVDDHPQAYTFFTITDPMSVHPGTVLLNPLPPGTTVPPEGWEPEYRPMTDYEIEALRERFRVKIRRTLNESIRKEDAFDYITNPGGSGRTMIPKVIWGSGAPNGFGRGYQYKDWDTFMMTYTTRSGAGTTPAGTEIGIRLQDDGCYYFDMEANDWRLIGSGSFDEDELKELLRRLLPDILEEHFGLDINLLGQHIIMPRLPTQAEIDTFPINAVVFVYDPDNPFIPTG